MIGGAETLDRRLNLKSENVGEIDETFLSLGDEVWLTGGPNLRKLFLFDGGILLKQFAPKLSPGLAVEFREIGFSAFIDTIDSDTHYASVRDSELIYPQNHRFISVFYKCTWSTQLQMCKK